MNPGYPGLDLGSWEPPYARESSDLDSIARVARLERRAEDTQQPEQHHRRQAPFGGSCAGEVRNQPLGEPLSFGPTLDPAGNSGDIQGQMMGRFLPVEQKSVSGTAQAESERRDQLSDSGGVATGVPVRPLREDNRELIPVLASNPQLEATLVRALEGNRALKGRLEQFETPSWNSGRSPTTLQNSGPVHESPASLMHPSVGPEMAYSRASPVQMFSSVVHARGGVLAEFIPGSRTLGLRVPRL